MKKTFIFALLAVALGFTACSNEDDILSETLQGGMELRATVEQPEATRGSISINGPYWFFSWNNNENILVTNDAIDDYYTFTGGKATTFKSTDAKTTKSPATWYAYYPSDEISLVNQNGSSISTDSPNIGMLYALAGKTTEPTTGAAGLNVTLKPQVAFLIIHNNRGQIDLNIKTGPNTWLQGLKAKAGEAAFEVTTSTTKQTVLSTVEKGIYYIVVPAEVQLSIKDGDETLKSTDVNGFKAGWYYSMECKNTGKAKANINGTMKDVEWVQLWDNGPKFAEYNVGTPTIAPGVNEEDFGGYYAWGGSINLKGYEDIWQVMPKSGSDKLTGDDDTATKLWGANWRMPTRKEFADLIANCEIEYVTGTRGYGVLFKGKSDSPYENNSVFFDAAGYIYGEDPYNYGVQYTHDCGGYWSSTSAPSTNGDASYYLNIAPGNSSCVISQCARKGRYRVNCYSVRAVLKEKPVVTGKAQIENAEGWYRKDVKWVQLWEEGPKFAETNVCAIREWNKNYNTYGSLYCWGGIEANTAYENICTLNNVSRDLKDAEDTAYRLWGSNWRMPTKLQLEALLNNNKCSRQWVVNYNGTGVNGMLFTGLGDYSKAQLFLPAAGEIDCYKGAGGQGSYGYYRTRTYYGMYYDYNLYINSTTAEMKTIRRDDASSVRAIYVGN